MMKHPLTLSALALLVCASAQAATVDLRVLETTDLHSNMMDFDYYKDTPTDKFGLVRTASLIQQARQQAANAVLVDNGDIIQGSPLGDYMAAKGLKPGDVHPVYKAMNTLDYVVGNIGNHEFNYGLDYLKNAIAVPRQDPSVVAALMTQVTSRIGIVPTFGTYAYHPYLLARLVATLDQVSGGRIGWNAVTGQGTLWFDSLSMLMYVYVRPPLADPPRRRSPSPNQLDRAPARGFGRRRRPRGETNFCQSGRKSSH